jgi:hypothetical protein
MQNDFRPMRQRPTDLAQTDSSPQNTFQTQLPHYTPPPKPKKGFHKWFAWFHRLTKKQKIILLSVLAGLLIASFLIWWFAIRQPKVEPKSKPVEKAQKEAPKPTTVASRLTGLQIPPELNALPTTGIMIENSPDARPQSGLFDAGVIYEAIAEGGITRFLALYMESKPTYIGPVRSARPYYLDFLVPFDAPIVHAGGSADALAQIRTQGIKDIDHGANGGAFQRVSTRFAPHNLYTSRDQILAVQDSRGYKTSTFTGFVRKDKEEPAKPPTARLIDLRMSGPLYNVHYDYDATNNRYMRSEGGQAHMDEKAGQQLGPKVVVALIMSHHYAGVYSVYGTSGSGQMFVFQDGKVQTGTWSKSNRQAQFTFKDANGGTLKLNPGQTWLTVVSGADGVTYQP